METLLPLRPGQVKNCPEGGFVVATLERTMRKANLGAPIRVYNATGTQVQELKGHANYVRSLAFNGDSEIISGSFDGTAKRWNLDGSCVETLKTNHEGCVSCVMGVPSSSRIITGSSGSKVENGRSNAKLRVWESVASGTWCSSANPLIILSLECYATLISRFALEHRYNSEGDTPFGTQRQCERPRNAGKDGTLRFMFQRRYDIDSNTW